MESLTEALPNTEIWRSAPMQPGCYIFKGADRSVLYVGKAKRLRNRVHQYFQSAAHKPPKIQKLVRLIRAVEYVTAATEIDALLLEYALIKQYRPPFNAQLKKDIHPVHIKIDWHREVPGLQIVSETSGDYCFGYFFNKWDADEALALLNDIWHTPVCGRAHFDGKESRACLRYHLGQCMGPCANAADRSEYRRVLREVYRFLKGRDKKVLSSLKRAMRQASEALAFERAARLRDQYKQLVAFSKRMKTTVAGFTGKRLCLFIKGYHEEVFLLLYIKNGSVRRRVRYDSAQEWPGEKLARFTEGIVRNEWEAIENGETLANAAAAVYARKYFVNITRTYRSQSITRLLTEAFPKFINMINRG